MNYDKLDWEQKFNDRKLMQLNNCVKVLLDLIAEREAYRVEIINQKLKNEHK